MNKSAYWGVSLRQFWDKIDKLVIYLYLVCQYLKTSLVSVWKHQIIVRPYWGGLVNRTFCHVTWDRYSARIERQTVVRCIWSRVRFHKLVLEHSFISHNSSVISQTLNADDLIKLIQDGQSDVMCSPLIALLTLAHHSAHDNSIHEWGQRSHWPVQWDQEYAQTWKPEKRKKKQRY